MHRRAFLSTAGLAVLAGCSEAGIFPPDTPTGTPASEPTATAGTPTEPPTSTEPPTEAPTEGGTEPTASPTLAEARLDSARRNLQRAVAAYADQGTSDGEGLLGVDATATGFSSGAVLDLANRARDNLDDADRLDQGALADEIRDLRMVHRFLSRAALVQQYLGDAYANLGTLLGLVLNGSYTNADSERRSMAANVSTAGDAFEELVGTTEAAVMDSFDGLSPDEYTEKVASFEAEIGAFRTTDEALAELVVALKAFRKERDEYADEDRNYGTFSPEPFEAVSGTMADSPEPASLQGYIAVVNCLAESRADAATHMRSAATAREDGENEVAREEEAQTEAALDRCSL